MPPRSTALFSALCLLGALLRPASAQAAFLVEIFDSPGTLSGMAQAQALMAGPPSASGIFDTINFSDAANAAAGRFKPVHGHPDQPFPGGLTQTFALRVTATLQVAASGDYTFGIDSNDGAVLRIGGTVVVDDPGPHSRRTALGARFLTAGNHTLELLYYENAGIASLELFTASGLRTAFSQSAFKLLGGADNFGKLTTVVPLPPTAALLALAVVPLLLRRRH
jgi:hypothetical protein